MPIRAFQVEPLPIPIRVRFGTVTPENRIDYDRILTLPAGEEWNIANHVLDHTVITVGPLERQEPTPQPTGTPTTGQLVSQLYRRLLEDLGPEDFVQSGAKAAIDSLVSALQ